MAGHNQRYAKTAVDPRDLHRPLAPHENIEAEMVWREQRTVMASLTLRYNKAMLSPANGLKSAKYLDGRVEIRHEGNALPYRVLDKMRPLRETAKSGLLLPGAIDRGWGKSVISVRSTERQLPPNPATWRPMPRPTASAAI